MPRASPANPGLASAISPSPHLPSTMSDLGRQSRHKSDMVLGRWGAHGPLPARFKQQHAQCNGDVQAGRSPAIGMVTRWSQRSRVRRLSPRCSAPTTMPNAPR